jgi:hypothetical protein
MGYWQILNTSGTAIDIETSYSIRVLYAIGAGMPAVNNTVTNYGLIDGGLYQRAIVPPRELILQCITITSTGPTFHAARQNLINLIKRDRTTGEPPVKIRYVYDGSTFEIEGYYSGGLELGPVKKTIENFNIQFICPDPFWREITTNTTALNINSTTAITNTGTAEAFPVFTFVGTGNITQISNNTTGKVLNFTGLSVTTGETVTIDLSPGVKTVSSTVRGNLLSNVASGSSLSTFSLLVGPNTISVTADADFALATLAGDELSLLEGGDVLTLLESGSLNLTTKNIAYKNRHWSVDGV